MLIENKSKKPTLFSAIAIGVSTIIGSGWLFACYKTAQFAGPVGIYSWVIGAVLSILPALLLAEIATYYHNETGLFARLITLTHNRDMGVVISVSNLFYMMVVVPAEAEASVQYVAHVYMPISHFIFNNGHFTHLGIFIVCLFMLIYGLLNYWGMKLLARANNIITILKFFVPLATAIIFICAAYHPNNFTLYHNTIAPYGYSKMFSAVISCGIFYSFYGFNTITLFSSELENPQKNIPLALISAIVLCTGIYLIIQYAFIVSIDPHLVEQGWHNITLNSPLAQLAILLGLNWWAVVLYLDATISPSGTGTIFLGSTMRIATGMSNDKQLLPIFGNIHPKYGISRLALIFILLLCTALVVLFDNWEKIIIVVSVFMAISCMAIPVAYCRLRMNDPQTKRPFTLKGGVVISYVVYFSMTYLLTQCGFSALLLALVLHIVFFIAYCIAYYHNFKQSYQAFKSSWSLFFYLMFITLSGYCVDHHLLNETTQILLLFIISTINFRWLIHQKSFNCN